MHRCMVLCDRLRGQGKNQCTSALEVAVASSLATPEAASNVNTLWTILNGHRLIRIDYRHYLLDLK